MKRTASQKRDDIFFAWFIIGAVLLIALEFARVWQHSAFEKTVAPFHIGAKR